MLRVFVLLMVGLGGLMMTGCRAARAEFLRSEVGKVLPLPPVGEKMEVEVNSEYTDPRVMISFKSEKRPAEVVAYYMRELTARGFLLQENETGGDDLWGTVDELKGGLARVEKRNFSHSYHFKRGDFIVWGDRVYMRVNWKAESGGCEVDVTLSHHSHLGQWAMLPVVLPVLVVSLPQAVISSEGYTYFVAVCASGIVDFLY